MEDRLSCCLFTKSWNYTAALEFLYSRLPKIKQAIIDYFKKDLMNMLRTYKKLSFYSTFKTNVSRSEYLDLIKNENIARQ